MRINPGCVKMTIQLARHHHHRYPDFRRARKTRIEGKRMNISIVDVTTQSVKYKKGNLKDFLEKTT